MKEGNKKVNNYEKILKLGPNFNNSSNDSTDKHSESSSEDVKMFGRPEFSKSHNRVFIDTPYEAFEKSDLGLSIVDRFEQQVNKYPDKVAVKCNGKSLTYNELNKTANQIGFQIQKSLQAQEPQTVGLLFEHDIDSIIGMFGVLKAGKIITPLDTGYPDDRIQYIMEDSKTELLITNTSNLQHAEKLISRVSRTIPIINIDELDKSIPTENLGIKIGPEQVSHITYTSGSTGNPKGVMQLHQNVVKSAYNFTNTMHINSNDRITLFTLYAYSISASLIFYTLLSGAGLYLNDLKIEKNMETLSGWLTEERITVYVSAPSVYRFLMSVIPDKKLFPDIRLVLLSGEAVRKSDADLYKDHFYDSCIFGNMFGSSESMFISSFFVNKESRISGTTVPIGYAVDGLEILILKDNDELAEVYEPGELVYRTKYLAKGYLNLPEKTREVFVPDPLTKEGLVYRSGDLGRRLPDGSIEHLGRKDFQIKIRGNRIEIGEIETIIDTIEGITKCVINVFKKGEGDIVLIAYYVTDSEKQIDTAEIRSIIRQKLPEYMVPSYFMQIGKIPLTPSGKIDRKALPDISDLVFEETQYVAPRNEAETKLASIWMELLELDKVGIHDSFFDIGGDSIKGMKMAFIASKEGIDITFADLLKNKTIYQIIKNLDTPKDTQEEPLYEIKDEEEDELVQQPLKLEDINENDSKELAAKIQTDVTTYLHHALPLCVVNANKKLLPWFYEHFTQIYSITNENGYLYADYLEPWGAYRYVTDQVCVGYEFLTGITNMLEFVIRKVNAGYCLVMHLDEYYIPDKFSYRKSHFVHQSLVYGYDNTKKIIKAIGFNSYHMFSEYTIDYDTFIKSYEKSKSCYKEFAPWAETSALEIIKPKEFSTEYAFDINIFIKNLHDYLYSKGSESISYIIGLKDQLVKGADIKYGISVNDDILEHLKNLANGKYTMDYRSMHLIAEQKKALYTRLSFVSQRYDFKDDLTDLIDKYKKIVEKANSLRVKFFEMTFTGDDDFYNPIPDRYIVEQIISSFELLKEEEKELLESIYKQLSIEIAA